ncbi:hypothetical protein K2173_020339 [Erythroxylum novogranatense]|uniref:Malectin-like domain-containing protein n=1 Tax=Erythroxylum novogranatense TaxID=1862640 RepID=A0AAV8UBI9_9ROSI|nr:hypothetical protein K2173_020339 [Erythroxylum novogranatense]
MALYLSMIITILNLLLSITISQASGTYQPRDVILLNCGESSPIKTSDGRTWEGDTLSRFLPSNASMLSETSSASSQDSSVNPVPYMTARLIHSNFTYNFPVVSGPKFVCLYFYPLTYSSFNSSTSFFSVTANGYSLLSNFNAYLTVSSINHQASSFFKVFVITVWETEQLKITFTPSQSSFAFVNGLEIVSMPSNLYTKDLSFISYPLVNNGDLFYFDNSTALENSYRLNVGGKPMLMIRECFERGLMIRTLSWVIWE